MRNFIVWVMVALMAWNVPLIGLAGSAPKQEKTWTAEDLKEQLNTLKSADTADLIAEVPIVVAGEVKEAPVIEVARAPIVRRALIRLALRKMQRQKIKEGDAASANAIGTILHWRNAELFDALAEEITIRVAEEHPQGFPGSWVDQLTQLVEWLIEHSDEIIEMILKIIDLFASLEAQGWTNLYAEVTITNSGCVVQIYGTPPIV